MKIVHNTVLHQHPSIHRSATMTGLRKSSQFKISPPADKSSGNNNKAPKTNSHDRAGLFSRLYCLYAFPFMRRNYGKDFDLSDIDPACEFDKCDSLGDKLRVQWEKQLDKKANGGQPSLLRALWNTFGWHIVLLDSVCFFIVSSTFVDHMSRRLWTGLVLFITQTTHSHTLLLLLLVVVVMKITFLLFMSL